MAPGAAAAVDRFFAISERGSSVATEVRAGVVAWMTMAYIAVVNPLILCEASAVTPDDPFPFRSVATATCLTAVIAGIYMGVVSNLPFCVISGMGLNAYFALGVCAAYNVSWRVGLGVCFLHSVMLFLCIVTGLCARIQLWVPENVKKAITCGIGIFQAFIGFQMMGLVVASSDTLVQMGALTPKLAISLAALLLVVLMVIYKVKGAILWGILFASGLLWGLGYAPYPTRWVEMPTLEKTWLGLDLYTTVSEPRLWAAAVGFLFVSIFDIAGVQFGIGLSAGLIEDGKVPHGEKAFVAAALGSAIGALTGTSPVIIANESTAGVVEGGRTGLTSVVVALLFGVTAFITPLLEFIPSDASAVPLAVVGMFMMGPMKYIDWEDLGESFPAFMTIVVMPFTYSIANGVLAGILSHLFLTGSGELVTFFHCRLASAKAAHLDERLLDAAEIEDVAQDATPSWRARTRTFEHLYSPSIPELDGSPTLLARSPLLQGGSPKLV